MYIDVYIDIYVFVCIQTRKNRRRKEIIGKRLNRENSISLMSR